MSKQKLKLFISLLPPEALKAEIMLRECIPHMLLPTKLFQADKISSLRPLAGTLNLLRIQTSPKIYNINNIVYY